MYIVLWLYDYYLELRPVVTHVKFPFCTTFYFFCSSYSAFSLWSFLCMDHSFTLSSLNRSIILFLVFTASVRAPPGGPWSLVSHPDWSLSWPPSLPPGDSLCALLCWVPYLLVFSFWWNHLLIICREKMRGGSNVGGFSSLRMLLLYLISIHGWMIVSLDAESWGWCNFPLESAGPLSPSFSIDNNCFDTGSFGGDPNLPSSLLTSTSPLWMPLDHLFTLVFSGFPIVCLETHFALCWALDRALRYGNTTFKSRKLTCTMLHFKNPCLLLSLFPFQNLFHDYWTFDLQGEKISLNIFSFLFLISLTIFFFFLLRLLLIF